MRVAVAGGTGVVGHHVVEVARRRGHDVVAEALFDFLRTSGLMQAATR